MLGRWRAYWRGSSASYALCRANEQTGKVEFLFSTEIVPKGLRVTPVWPNTHQAHAAALPGYVNGVLKGKLLEDGLLVPQAASNSKEQFATP